MPGDGGQFFLSWLVLGPLGKINNVHFMPPTSTSSGKQHDDAENEVLIRSDSVA